MSFEIGKTYSGYEILDILKQSKTEISYRVRNTLAQRIEVLRILPRSIQDDQEQLERFLREIKVHAQLVHPNIVAFYNAMELERQVVMTTELEEGVTVAERLELGPLAPAEARGLVLQALSALSYAHSRNVVHRDITPEHMLIAPGGVLKLTHFGLAKAAASPQLTQNGAVLGNLKYIPPEQVKGQGNLDPRSDLYSLGVVLYEMLVGKPPFESKSQFELMLAHVSEVPKPPSTVNPSVPPEFDAPVLKALGKSPADRFQNADEFRQSLEKPAEGTSKAVAAPPPIQEPAAAPATPPAAPAELPAKPPTVPVPPFTPAMASVPERGAAQEAIFASAAPAPFAQLTVIGLAATAIAVLVVIAYLVIGK